MPGFLNPGRLVPILILLFLVCALPIAAAIPGGLKKTKEGAYEGNRTDQYNLAIYYLHEGRGDDAFEWFQKSAHKGHARAQHNLGVLYQKGVGSPRDFQKARHWIERAAKQGIPEAQLEMGLLYYWGRGVPKNPQEAAKWFRVSGRAGLAASLSSLGSLHFRGKDFPKNPVKALAYYHMGLKAGDSKAKRWVDYLSKEMDEKQRREAKRLSAGDFRDLRWGMPIGRFSHGNKYSVEKRGEEKVIGLETSYAGKYYFMEWVFLKDILARIVLMQSFPNVDDIYDDLKNRFQKLHGSPEKEGYGSQEGVTREFSWLIPGLFEKTRVKIQKTESPTLFGLMKKKGIRVVYEPENPDFLKDFFPNPESEPSEKPASSPANPSKSSE